jgi:hypothetical protein
MSENVSYGLLVSFPDGSPSFVHGYEAGLVGSDMKRAEPEIKRTVHIENKEVLTRMAISYGYSFEFEACSVEGWLEATFNKIAEPKRVNPHGLRVIK